MGPQERAGRLPFIIDGSSKEPRCGPFVVPSHIVLWLIDGSEGESHYESSPQLIT